MISAQPNYFRGDFNSWGTLSLTDRGVVKACRFQENITSPDRYFKFDQANDWVNNWGAGTTITNNSVYTAYAGGENGKYSSINGYYYTFIIGDGTGNQNASVLETSYNPKTISSVSQNPSSNVLPSQLVTVSATLSNTLSTSEYCYLRYSTNSWSSSTLVSMSFSSGTNYTASIPIQSGSTTVSYYCFTSNQSSLSSNFDYFTLELNNNSGSNYSYTVLNPITVEQVTIGRPIQTYYLGDKFINDWNFQYQINQTSWYSSEAGIGQNTDGETGWSWEGASYYADNGVNKRVERNMKDFQFTSTGTFYVVGRSKTNSSDPWTFADENTATNETTLTCSTSSGNCPYFTVNALNTPTSYSAALNGTNPSTQIDLSWTKDAQAHNVMILRKKSTDSWTEPTQGAAYSVGNTIGAATVVYNGSGTSFTDNVNSSTGYDYKFYSENWSYYSGGVTSGTITTNTNITDHFRSKATGNWNSSSCWESSYDGSYWINATEYPGANSYVVSIYNLITLSEDASAKNIAIHSGGTLDISSYTLNLGSDGSTGYLSINGGGTFNCNAGTLSIKHKNSQLTNNGGTFISGTGKVNFYGDGSVGNYAIFGGTLNFYDVEIQNGGIDFGSASTISGTLTIKNNGYVQTNAPTYTSGSTLVYNTGGAFTVTTEWNSPYNVTVTNNTEIDFDGAWDRYILANLLIESGSKVKLSNTFGADLYIKGNFTNQGIFDPNSREVIFEGTGIQEIDGSSATTFSYLRINNSAGVVLNSSSTVTVNDRLAVDAGTVTINPLKAFTVTGLTENNTGNSCIIIKSDATGTGSLIHNTADIKGNIERYITGSTDPHKMMYHMASIPMDTANASYSGLFEGSYLFYFREDTNYWKGLGSPLYTPLDETRGYLVYYILGDNITYSFDGKMNYTAFTPHLESHVTSPTDKYHGWNLVPNPFPSALNWDESGWTKTDIDGSIYFWPAGTDYYTGVYSSWNGTIGTGTPTGTRYIPVGQAFFVHASTTAPALVIPNSAKVHSTQAYYKNGEEILPNALRLICSDNFAHDDLVVHFREDATSAFDTQCDAYKLIGGSKVPQISTTTDDGIRAAINSLPLASGQQVVPVNLNYYQAAQLKFTASGMENFEHQPTIYLEDKLENKLIDLNLQPEYTFDYNTTDTARFNLIFTDYTNNEKHEASSFNAYQQNEMIRILYPELRGNKATVRIYDMTGKLVSTNSLVFEDVVSVKAPAVPGVYVIQIQSGNKAMSKRIVIL